MEELVILLTSCEAMLRRVGENFWVNKLLTAINKIKSNNMSSAYDEIITWYGGMGSFNDLIISKINGHFIDEGDDDSVNNELSLYRRKIYDLTQELQRREALV